MYFDLRFGRVGVTLQLWERASKNLDFYANRGALGVNAGFVVRGRAFGISVY